MRAQLGSPLLRNGDKAMTWQESYLKTFYYGVPGWIDGTTEFHQLCARAIRPGSSILEIGAGASNQTSAFLAELGTLRGVDIDADVKTNASLAEAHVITGDQYPFSSHTFDVCVSNYVVEHVEHVDQHLAEIRRVLKPRGLYVFRTPNARHYTALTSRLTPYWFHTLVANRLRNLPTHAHDPFPTFYRMNSAAAITTLSNAQGFGVRHLQYIEKEPSYGMGSRFLFFPFMAYERLVNSMFFLKVFRANMFVVLELI